MNDVSATDPPKPQRRLDRTAAVPTNGMRFYPRSRRGLRHRLIIVRRCPLCGDAHQFRDDGLRIASCGQGYLMVKSRKARTPTLPKESTVDAVVALTPDTTRGAP